MRTELVSQIVRITINARGDEVTDMIFHRLNPVNSCWANLRIPVRATASLSRLVARARITKMALPNAFGPVLSVSSLTDFASIHELSRGAV